ncbi:MAG: type II toxin-antitoxin system VapC family toxin [Thermomicrobiales bacterium]
MRIPQSLRARRVLLDSAAYYALADQRAHEHERAIRVHADLIARRFHLFTTNFILAETHSLLLNRRGRDVAARMLRTIDASYTTIVRVRWSDEERARGIIFAQEDKDYTLTDATSFAVMERLHIGTAFTFDRHFAQFGFAVLGPGDP